MQKLNYSLDRHASLPLYVQLYQQIRQGIYQEQLKLGDKLPSKRLLCDYLQISQNTVENAYAQLQAEGYIESRPRSGFFVCFQLELALPPAVSPNPPGISSPEASFPLEKKAWAFDLNPNYIDTQHFPFEAWKKSGRFLHNKAQQQLLTLGNNQGDWNLRQQIAHYLQASRGIYCDADQIIIGSGVETCMQQLILLFQQQMPNPVYAMEAYGYEKVRQLLGLYQQPVISLPLQADNKQLDLKHLNQQAVNIAFVTPSNLYPFGEVLSIGQRQALLEWAGAKPNRYIIEDDYDSEFRYKGKPIPALQSLDQQHKVIYLGSFSKLMMPALRLSFMVLPKPLLKQYQQVCSFFHCSVSRFEQQRLANFMEQGEFDKHIQRMRKIYRRKMECLCQRLNPYSDRLSYYGEHSGFHLLVESHSPSLTAKELAKRAAEQNILVYPIDFPDKCLLSLGFGHLSESELNQVISMLLSCWVVA